MYIESGIPHLCDKGYSFPVFVIKIPGKVQPDSSTIQQSDREFIPCLIAKVLSKRTAINRDKISDFTVGFN